MIRFNLSVAGCVFFLCVNTAFGFDAIRLDAKTKLFQAMDKTVPVVSAKYVGWTGQWEWAGLNLNRGAGGGKHGSDEVSYTGSIPKFDINFNANAHVKNDQLLWNYTWDKKANFPDAKGFGIEFNLKLDSASFSTPAQDPELLPDNKGWRWQTPDGKTLEVTFSPKLAKLYFERNNKSKIRAMIFEQIATGSEKTAMAVSLTGNDAKSLPIELPGNSKDKDTSSWHRDILSDIASPVDLSFLNAKDLPAGKHGFVKAQGDQMVFEDGTPVKFWGANVMAYALFKTPDHDIKAHAKRIAKLGFNLIRIHHHDSGWVKPNIFINPEDNTQKLSDQSLKKLDMWITSLKEEGIYIWLDLHVGRMFTEKDGIDHFDELVQAEEKKNKGKKPVNAVVVKGFNYYDESIQKQMKSFNKAYLTHVNTYSGLSYAQDPAIIALLLTNENDLTHHFGNLFLSQNNVPEYNAIFKYDVKQFSDSNGYKGNKAGQAWELGEPKIYLSDVEHRFNQKMIADLRGLGAKSMIATTNSWGKMGLAGLPSLTDGNVIDAHAYGQAGELYFDPRYNPGFLAWLGAAQVTGKPLSVTEWNISPFPVEDRFTAPVYTASIASLQGWDAMMLYGYSQANLGAKINGGNFSSFNDPALIGMMPAAALLFRQGHVSIAKNHYELKLNREDFFFKKQNPTTSKSIRTLLETSRFSVSVPEVKELPWLKAVESPSKTALVITDANKDFIPQGQDFVQSDTAELKRDWKKGIQTINTAKTQIALGRIGGENIELTDVAFKINTNDAVVAVQSLDDKALKNSKEIFITVMARSEPSKGHKLPFLSEPVSGEISITAPGGLKLFPINRTGEKGKPQTLNYTHGVYHLKLEENSPSHWFLLTARD